MKEKNRFSRQPRFLPEMPSGEIVMLVITILLALTVKSVFMLISIATTLVTLIGSVVGAFSQIRKFKKKKEERERKYLQFIKDTRSHLSIIKEQQIKAMNEMNPEPSECINRINQIDKKLWERTPSFKDFLSIRLGLGSVPIEIAIKYTKQAIIMENDPLLNEPQRLALEFEKIQDVPVTVNLMETEICGISGEDEKIAQILQLLTLQIITHHGYDDVRLVILAKEEGLSKWNFLKHLAHIWNDSFT